MSTMRCHCHIIEFTNDDSVTVHKPGQQSVVHRVGEPCYNVDNSNVVEKEYEQLQIRFHDANWAGKVIMTAHGKSARVCDVCGETLVEREEGIWEHTIKCDCKICRLAHASKGYKQSW